MTKFISREQPLKANIRFRIIGKTLCIMLKVNHTMECQFLGSPQLQGEVSESSSLKSPTPILRQHEEDSVDGENWQDVDNPKDSISADSGNRKLEAEIASVDPKPVGEGDAVHVQQVQREENPNYWMQSIWSWVKT